MGGHDLWGETKHPKPEDQLPPEELRFVDPAERMEHGSDRDDTTHRLAIASAVLGVLGTVLCCAPILSFILGICAIVLGIAVIRREHTEKERLARIGIWLGVFALFCGILAHFLFPAMFRLLSPVGDQIVPDDIS